jgi:hypothetical protein
VGASRSAAAQIPRSGAALRGWATRTALAPRSRYLIEATDHQDFMRRKQWWDEEQTRRMAGMWMQ